MSLNHSKKFGSFRVSRGREAIATWMTVVRNSLAAQQLRMFQKQRKMTIVFARWFVESLNRKLTRFKYDRIRNSMSLRILTNYFIIWSRVLNVVQKQAILSQYIEGTHQTRCLKVSFIKWLVALHVEKLEKMSVERASSELQILFLRNALSAFHLNSRYKAWSRRVKPFLESFESLRKIKLVSTRFIGIWLGYVGLEILAQVESNSP